MLVKTPPWYCLHRSPGDVAELDLTEGSKQSKLWRCYMHDLCALPCWMSSETSLQGNRRAHLKHPALMITLPLYGAALNFLLARK